MKPLGTIQRFLIWLCIHPADESTTIRQKRIYTIFASVVFFVLLITFLASLAFCFVSADLGKSLFAFMIAAAELNTMYMMIIGIVVMRPKMTAIFTDLSGIVKNSKCWKFRIHRIFSKLCFPRCAAIYEFRWRDGFISIPGSSE